MPPEVLRGRSNRDESAVYGLPVDVWSAGVVTFEVATMTAFLDPGEKARLWKGYCYKHDEIVKDLTPTWSIVVAAKRLN